MTNQSLGNKRSTIEFGSKKTRIGGGKIENADSYTEDDYNQTPDYQSKVEGNSSLNNSHIAKYNLNHGNKIKDFSASVRETVMKNTEAPTGRSQSTAAAGFRRSATN